MVNGEFTAGVGFRDATKLAGEASPLSDLRSSVG
jgi:hypothetical protein